jgi:hypothetical protein
MSRHPNPRTRMRHPSTLSQNDFHKGDPERPGSDDPGLASSMAQFLSFSHLRRGAKNWRSLRTDFGTHPSRPVRSNGRPRFGSSCRSPTPVLASSCDPIRVYWHRDRSCRPAPSSLAVSPDQTDVSDPPWVRNTGRKNCSSRSPRRCRSWMRLHGDAGASRREFWARTGSLRTRVP